MVKTSVVVTVKAVTIVVAVAVVWPSVVTVAIIGRSGVAVIAWSAVVVAWSAVVIAWSAVVVARPLTVIVISRSTVSHVRASARSWSVVVTKSYMRYARSVEVVHSVHIP